MLSIAKVDHRLIQLGLPCQEWRSVSISIKRLARLLIAFGKRQTLRTAGARAGGAGAGAAARAGRVATASHDD